MKKNEPIVLYGVITDAECIMNTDYLVTFKEDTTGKVWTLIVAKESINCDLIAGTHCLVDGVLCNLAKDSVFVTFIDEWGRYCSHCGKHMTEGYYVYEHQYACSEECAIALCGSEQAFKESIWLDEDGELAEDSPTYWTEWE
jgi:hypothetical protein